MDATAELQHEIRQAAHDVGGLCGFANGVRLAYERGDYGEVDEYLASQIERLEVELRQMSYTFARRKHEAAEAAVAVERNRERMRAARAVRDGLRRMGRR